MAEEFVRRPPVLAKIIEESALHFQLYSNVDEAFQDARTEIAGETDERRLIRAIRDGRHHIVGDSELVATLACDFVANHVYTCRTTRSTDETGRGAPSQSLDVLLANREDRRPIVGEIKARGDTNAFFGLMQAITYAIELTTPPQLQRLQQNYGNRVWTDPPGPFADIYLILIDQHYGEDNWHSRILDLTSQVAATQLALSPLHQLIRRIVCLDAQLASLGNGADEARMSPVFVHGALHQ